MSTVIMSQQLYGVGTFTGAPQPLPAGATTITASVVLSAADAANAANQGVLVVLVSLDGGRTFEPIVSSPWAGGTLDKSGAVIAPSVSVGAPAGATHASASLQLAQPLSAGLTLDFS